MATAIRYILSWVIFTNVFAGTFGVIADGSDSRRSFHQKSKRSIQSEGPPMGTELLDGLDQEQEHRPILSGDEYNALKAEV